MPAGSKLLSRKWAEKEHSIHKQKLKKIKSAMEIKEPATFAHLSSKAKKE
jgi:hypothetical protein